jgi:hypothetical protein
VACGIPGTGGEGGRVTTLGRLDGGATRGRRNVPPAGSPEAEEPVDPGRPVDPDNSVDADPADAVPAAGRPHRIPVEDVPVPDGMPIPDRPPRAKAALAALRAGWVRAKALPSTATRGSQIRAMAVWGAPLALIMGVAALFRFWHLTAIGFNSDEAVYAGSAAALTGDPDLAKMFPVFRAHPLLMQTLLALISPSGMNDWRARALAAAIGIATVAVTYALGARLYRRSVGLIAAAVLAVMPYHVVVSRQVLLDGLMTLGATVVLYCLARYAESVQVPWLVAGASVMGLTILAKETSLVLLGGAYAFFALTPRVRVKLRHLAIAAAAGLVTLVPLPAALALSHRASSGQSYLLWQIFRRANHPMWFYLQVVPAAVGIAVIVAALVGVVWLWRERTWRERLLLCWITIPVVFFSLWPVKGYQYLLPIAPVLAVLAARTIAALPTVALLHRRQWLPRAAVVAAALLTVVSVGVPAWSAVNPTPGTTFLAGTGGLPGGREAGVWVRANVPEGAQLIAIGPSMANVLQFYGHRSVSALSVSPDPSVRNPSYRPVLNPDLAVRYGEYQYVVWDSYTAARAPFFATKARQLIDKYRGVAVYTGTVMALGQSGTPTITPVIIIYQVRAV